MARITIEDCLKNVDNVFELVLIASKRARQLSDEGATSLVPIENDKPTVIALREIAANLINKSILEDNKIPSAATAEDTGEISKEIIAETQTLAEESTQPVKDSASSDTESE